MWRFSQALSGGSPARPTISAAAQPWRNPFLIWKSSISMTVRLPLFAIDGRASLPRLELVALSVSSHSFFSVHILSRAALESSLFIFASLRFPPASLVVRVSFDPEKLKLDFPPA